jgi:hypothetical protein
MANTSTLGPLSNLTPPGRTAWIGADRLHRDQTGVTSAAAVNTTYGSTWYNCFDSGQIPVGATIDGIELISETINSGTGFFGTAGSTGAAESGTIEIYFYNGSSYSTAVYSNTFTGANDYFPVPNGGGQVIAGGSSDLSGLSWNPSNQSNFGFRIDITAIVGTPVLVTDRGLALKVYYTEVVPTNSRSLTISSGKLTINSGKFTI